MRLGAQAVMGGSQLIGLPEILTGSTLRIVSEAVICSVFNYDRIKSLILDTAGETNTILL